MEREYVLQPEKLALSVLVSRNTREITGLYARIVSDGHLLLLVNLTRIYELLDGPGPKKPVDVNVASLPKAVCAVHCL